MNVPSAVMPTPKASSPGNALASRRISLNRFSPLVYLLVTIGSAFVAYWAMFSEFAPYDDSGFFIHSIRLFSEGQALYNQVFTDYGPFSYELWAALFGLTGHVISTDSGRLAIVALWLLTSLLLGVSAQRLTGRLALGVIVQVLSFSVLSALTAEPMHASGVVCALFAAVAADISFVLPRHTRAGLIALGAIVAALALTKVNVGGFAAIAVAYATVMTLPALRRIAAVRWLAGAAMVAIGPILMYPDLHQQWAQNYAILAVAGGLAIALTAATPTWRDASDGSARQWVIWLSSGFAACAVVVVGVLLVLGTSLSALVQETVILPTHQGTAFTLPISLTGDIVFWAVGAVGAAWVVSRLRLDAGGTRPPPLIGALGRIAAALAIWLSIVAIDPLNISPENANFALAMTLAWIAAIPSSRDDGSAQGRFVRVLIPSFAVLQALMAYPVAGTQVPFGSLFFLVCGAVCFADGWSDLEAWGAARGVLHGARTPRTVMLGLAAALAVALTFQLVVRPIEFWGDAYAANPHLPIAGATRLHLPAAQVSTFSQITTLLRSRCHTVITLPGLLSFNLWSGLPAPSGLTAEPFWHLLSHSQEQSALAAARAAPGLCSVRNDQQAANWGNGTPPPQVPLVRFIEQDFTPIAQYEGYVVSVRRP